MWRRTCCGFRRVWRKTRYELGGEPVAARRKQEQYGAAEQTSQVSMNFCCSRTRVWKSKLGSGVRRCWAKSLKRQEQRRDSDGAAQLVRLWPEIENLGFRINLGLEGSESN